MLYDARIFELIWFPGVGTFTKVKCFLLGGKNNGRHVPAFRKTSDLTGNIIHRHNISLLDNLANLLSVLVQVYDR